MMLWKRLSMAMGLAIEDTDSNVAARRGLFLALVDSVNWICFLPTAQEYEQALVAAHEQLQAAGIRFHIERLRLFLPHVKRQRPVRASNGSITG